jgi:hypothetical protein
LNWPEIWPEFCNFFIPSFWKSKQYHKMIWDLVIEIQWDFQSFLGRSSET